MREFTIPDREKLIRLLETRAVMSPDETIQDVREACRHIDYHLKDAKLVPGI